MAWCMKKMLGRLDARMNCYDVRLMYASPTLLIYAPNELLSCEFRVLISTNSLFMSMYTCISGYLDMYFIRNNAIKCNYAVMIITLAASRTI